jgi:hypothetical protein
MNCAQYQNYLEAYCLTKLHSNVRTEVEVHLRSCRRCAGLYKLMTLAGRVMDEEKELQSNPFLPIRIMARIEDIRNPVIRRIPAFTRVAKPAILLVSLTVVIALGVLLGNIYRPVQHRDSFSVEMSWIDDAAIESVTVLSNDQN